MSRVTVSSHMFRPCLRAHRHIGASVLPSSQSPARKDNLPLVTIRTGFPAADGSEEVLTAYLCDWPGCANRAIHWLGCIPDIRVVAIVCEKHVPPTRQPSRQCK